MWRSTMSCNVRQVRPFGYDVEHPRCAAPTPYRNPQANDMTWTAPPRLHDHACHQLRLLLTAYPCVQETHTFFTAYSYIPVPDRKNNVVSSHRFYLPIAPEELSTSSDHFLAVFAVCFSSPLSRVPLPLLPIHSWFKPTKTTTAVTIFGCSCLRCASPSYG